jgi:hypothetical protein
MRDARFTKPSRREFRAPARCMATSATQSPQKDLGHPRVRTCQSSFQAWVQEEQNPSAASTPEPLPGPWTELATYDTDYVDGGGDVLRDYVRLYRANDNNLQSEPRLLTKSFNSTCAETVPKPHLFGFSEVAI